MLVEHHKKYREIHGVDETVWMEQGDHQKLHNRLSNHLTGNTSISVRFCATNQKELYYIDGE